MAGYALYQHLDGHLTRTNSMIRSRRQLMQYLEEETPPGARIAAVVLTEDVARPLMLVS